MKRLHIPNGADAAGAQLLPVCFQSSFPTAIAIHPAATLNLPRPARKFVQTVGNRQWTPVPVVNDISPNPYSKKYPFLKVTILLNHAHFAGAKNLFLKNSNQQKTQKL